MRLASKYRKYEIVLKPTDYRYDSRGHRMPQLDKGISLMVDGVREGVCDVDAVAARENWTPDTKMWVEDRLRNHPDRGSFFHIEDEPQGSTEAPVASGPVESGCIGMLVVPGEPTRVCGKPTEEDSDYCSVHAQETAGV